MSLPVTACTLDRDQFPKGFIIGAASSAFQVEGAASEGGRGQSIWDTFCKKKGWVLGKAIDHYNRYKEDVALMKWVGLDAYRFSISWSRILPTGKKKGGVNAEGVKYYKDLIQELRKNGIIPFVTLFHWDVPQALEDEYGGFRGRKIIDDFEDYADVCFMEFGNIVKHWITINEPWSFCEGGYALGSLAPGRGDVSEDPTSKIKDSIAPTMTSHCTDPPQSRGDPAREPYLVAHHQLLAHARAAKLYKDKYKKPNRSLCHCQNSVEEEEEGQIGIALNCNWFKPHSKSKQDKDATNRALDFTFNWFLRPITRGKYPKNVQTVMETREIPTFSPEESTMLKGSLDFLGVNYYTASYVCDDPDEKGKDEKEKDQKGEDEKGEDEKGSHITDAKVKYLKKCVLGDDWGAVDWLKVYPRGLKKVLKYVKLKYTGPIYITENGFGEKDVESMSLHEALYDHKRVSYHHQHLSSMLEAIKEYKVDVRGYFAWSLWDNFEWAACFDVRFGAIYVDFKNDMKRTPKFSAQWFKFILQKPRKKSVGLIDTNPEGGGARVPNYEDDDSEYEGEETENIGHEVNKEPIEENDNIIEENGGSNGPESENNNDIEEGDGAKKDSTKTG